MLILAAEISPPLTCGKEISLMDEELQADLNSKRSKLDLGLACYAAILLMLHIQAVYPQCLLPIATPVRQLHHVTLLYARHIASHHRRLKGGFLERYIVHESQVITPYAVVCQYLEVELSRFFTRSLVQKEYSYQSISYALECVGLSSCDKGVIKKPCALSSTCL